MSALDDLVGAARALAALHARADRVPSSWPEVRRLVATLAALDAPPPPKSATGDAPAPRQEQPSPLDSSSGEAPPLSAGKTAPERPERLPRAPQP